MGTPEFPLPRDQARPNPLSVVPSTGPLTSGRDGDGSAPGGAIAPQPQPAVEALSLSAQFEAALHALGRYSQADTDRFTQLARQQLRGEGREPVLRPLVIRAALIARQEERAALEQLQAEPDPRADTDPADDDPDPGAPYPQDYPDEHPDLHEYDDDTDDRPDYDEGL